MKTVNIEHAILLSNGDVAVEMPSDLRDMHITEIQMLRKIAFPNCNRKVTGKHKYYWRDFFNQKNIHGGNILPNDFIGKEKPLSDFIIKAHLATTH